MMAQLDRDTRLSISNRGLVSKGIEFNNARLASARMQALTTS